MKYKFILLLSVILISSSFAQRKFSFDYDYARFNYDDSSSYLELYYSFFQPDFTIVNEGNEKYIEGGLKVKIIDQKTNNIVVNKEFQFKSNFNDSVPTAGTQSLIGNLGFKMLNGDYTCVVIGRDLHRESSYDSLQFEVQIRSLPADRFTLSDIQLANSITQSENKNSIFYKNSFEIIPNPTFIFGQNYPVIYFYSEIYNLTKNKKSDYLKVEQILFNSNNVAVVKKGKFIGRNNDAVVEVGAINIVKIPTGSYTLALAITDTVLHLSAITSKKVFIYNPNVIDTLQNLIAGNESLASEFGSMEEEELNESFSIAKYISSGQEIDKWNKIKDLDAKRTFMFEFWKKRDEMPYTPQNEFKADYLKRVDYSNSKFSTITKKGWKSDRGRVYIVYGEPSEIERFPNQVDAKPYEIWHYNSLEGGVIFVFADLTGFSDYMLIHSTLRGELRDENWQRRVFTN
jgi:GWxTD domain-containing protein